MSAPRRERETFIAQAVREGLSLDTSRALLSAAATLQRLAEAQCNGDWPAGNGQRPVVPCGGAEDAGCGSYWDASALAGPARLCVDCRTAARVKARLAADAPGWTVILQGDPRGYVLKVRPASRPGRPADDAIGVPA